MTQLVRGSISGRLDPTWRRVPKIDLLPRTRRSFLTPVVLGLLALILVQAVVARYLLGELAAADEAARAARSDLVEANASKFKEENAIVDQEESITGLDTEEKQLTRQLDLIASTQSALQAERPDWAVALKALLGADGPAIRFQNVVTTPEGDMTVTGVATGLDAMSGFQTHMLSVEDVLDLLSLQWEEGDSDLVFTAEIRVR